MVEETTPKKKKRSSMSSVQRTIRQLKDNGMVCAVVEKWNPFVGEHGIRQDLFGIIDILALDPIRGVIGVQCCGSDFSSHIRKITVDKAQETEDWLNTPGTRLEIWGWRKVKKKRGGKQMVWRPRIQEITLFDLQGEDLLPEQESKKGGGEVSNASKTSSIF